jgi:hypothetical protein
MRLSIQLKLLPTPQQADALRRTLETANAACDYIIRGHSRKSERLSSIKLR